MYNNNNNNKTLFFDIHLLPMCKDQLVRERRICKNNVPATLEDQGFPSCRENPIAF